MITNQKFVFFDLDGTLADTELLKANALVAAAKYFGGVASTDFYKNVMGQSWEAVTASLFENAGIQISLDSFNPVFRKQYESMIEAELTDTRHAAKFVELLKKKDIGIGLVSSASPWMIQKVVSKLKLEGSFDVVVSNADTQKHKPSPDSYLLALKKLNAPPTYSIAFEDSDSGFKAAINAGLAVYGVRHDFNYRHDFSVCRNQVESFKECLEWSIVKV